MPRYGYMRPRAKVYAYNYGYMNNYIQPMTHYMSSRETTPAPIDKPGAMVLAERLKKFPLDGTIYPDKDTPSVMYRRPSAAPSMERETPLKVAPFLPKEADMAEEPMSPTQRRWMRASSLAPLEEIHRGRSPSLAAVQDDLRRQRASSLPPEEERRVSPVNLRHPYRLAVEDEVMPLREGTIWPEGRKHFHLVSSYDAMCGYLGLLPVITRS